MITALTPRFDFIAAPLESSILILGGKVDERKGGKSALTGVYMLDTLTEKLNRVAYQNNIGICSKASSYIQLQNKRTLISFDAMSSKIF